MRSVLAGCDPEVTRSRRAQTRLAELREKMPFCTEDDSSLVTDAAGTIQSWTFTGLGANAVLAQRLKSAGEQVTRFDNFSVQLEREPSAPLSPVMHSAARGVEDPAWHHWMDQLKLKFHLCLPMPAAQATIIAGLTDPAGADAVQRETVRTVRLR